MDPIKLPKLPSLPSQEASTSSKSFEEGSDSCASPSPEEPGWVHGQWLVMGSAVGNSLGLIGNGGWDLEGVHPQPQSAAFQFYPNNSSRHRAWQIHLGERVGSRRCREVRNEQAFLVSQASGGARSEIHR